MAITQNLYTGNGSTTNYSFTFPYIEETDIKVSLDGSDTTAYTLANATTIQFNTAPSSGVAIRIYRQTNDESLPAQFYPGSAIRSQDLNDNFSQNLYVTQEVVNNSLNTFGDFIITGGWQFAVPVSGSVPTAAGHLVTKAYADALAFNSGNLSPGDKGAITVNSVDSWTLNDNSVVTATIADGAVTEAKLSFVPVPATRLYYISSF